MSADGAHPAGVPSVSTIPVVGARLLTAGRDDHFVQQLLTEYGEELVRRKPTSDQRDRVAAWNRDTTIEYSLIVIDGSPAGCVGLRPIDASTAEVVRMFVRATHRRNGLGRSLLTAAEDRARQLGFKRVRLDTMSELFEAKALYQASGYLEIADYNDNPVADTWFEKTL